MPPACTVRDPIRTTFPTSAHPILCCLLAASERAIPNFPESGFHRRFRGRPNLSVGFLGYRLMGSRTRSERALQAIVERLRLRGPSTLCIRAASPLGRQLDFTHFQTGSDSIGLSGTAFGKLGTLYPPCWAERWELPSPRPLGSGRRCLLTFWSQVVNALRFSTWARRQLTLA